MRRREVWEIVKEINLYSKQLQFEENMCRQIKPIMKIKKAAAKIMSSEGYTLCYITGAEEIDGGINLFGRFVTGYGYNGAEKYAMLGETFHLAVKRENGLTIAKVLRKAFKPKEIRIG